MKKRERDIDKERMIDREKKKYRRGAPVIT